MPYTPRTLQIVQKASPHHQIPRPSQQQFLSSTIPINKRQHTSSRSSSLLNHQAPMARPAADARLESVCRLLTCPPTMKPAPATHLHRERPRVTRGDTDVIACGCVFFGAREGLLQWPCMVDAEWAGECVAEGRRGRLWDCLKVKQGGGAFVCEWQCDV